MIQTTCCDAFQRRFWLFELSDPPSHHNSLHHNIHHSKKNRFAETNMSEVTIELRTAPRDRRFPTQNQTKHCWARYLEFHSCAKKKGEDDPECEKFKRWYNALCPLEWVSFVFFLLLLFDKFIFLYSIH